MYQYINTFVTQYSIIKLKENKLVIFEFNNMHVALFCSGAMLCNLTAQNWSFSLRISSVNVTKSAVFCGFGHIYWRNP